MTQTQTNGTELNVPIQSLFIDPLNSRTQRAEKNVDALKSSIKANGLIQPLAGYQREDGIGIVAGGTRLSALKALYEEGDTRFGTIPVILAETEEQARAWSNAENIVRNDLSPYDEIIAYRSERDIGKTVSQIAIEFGKTEAHVLRRLKLADLSETILDALRDGRITLDAAAAFTIAKTDRDALDVLMRLLNEKDRQVEDVRDIKRLLNESPIYTSHRYFVFVGWDAYSAAGGTTTEDLFAVHESNRYSVDDHQLLFDLANAKIEAEASKLTSEGYCFVDVSDSSHFGMWHLSGDYQTVCHPEIALSESDQERYDALAEIAELEGLSDEEQMEVLSLDAKMKGDFSQDEKAVIGFTLFVDHEGNLCRSGPYVRSSEFSAAQKIGLIKRKSSKGSDTSLSGFSQALSSDLSSLDRLAFQTAFMDHGDLLLDLLSFAVSPYAQKEFNPFDLSFSPMTIIPSKEDKTLVDKRLAQVNVQGPQDYSFAPIEDQTKTFEKFRRLKKDKRLEFLVAALARLVNPSALKSGLGDLMHAKVQPNVRAVWTPTYDNFFKRVSSDDLSRFHMELTGSDMIDPGFDALKKKEKGEILDDFFTNDDVRKVLSKEQIEVIDHWVPTPKNSL